MSQGSDAASPQHTQSPDTELATLKRQYQLLLNAVGEGIYGLDLQGNVTFVNPAAAAMIDWPMEELIGQSMHLVLHYAHQDGAHYPREDCPIYAALHDGSTHRVTNEVFWRKDGTSFPVEYISTPMRDEQGNVIGAVVTFRDITQRRWAESILQQTNEELEKKVRSRTVELYTTNQHLQEMSDLKSRFVSMVCHEFRNPLNNIALSVSSLGRYDQQMPQAQKQTYLKSITANVERMTQMTDDILVLSKLEANRLTLNPQSLDLVDFCHALIKEIPPNQRRLSFTGRFQPLLAEIDPILLRSILVNILSNAVRYSEANGLVQLSLCQRKQKAVFQIKDEGIGILPEDYPHLFEPFHRGKNVSNIPGTGLGLSIVKQFVSLHSGSLKVESTPGVGTTFQVRLPLKRDS